MFNRQWRPEQGQRVKSLAIAAAVAVLLAQENHPSPAPPLDQAEVAEVQMGAILHVNSGVPSMQELAALLNERMALKTFLCLSIAKGPVATPNAHLPRTLPDPAPSTMRLLKQPVPLARRMSECQTEAVKSIAIRVFVGWPSRSASGVNIQVDIHSPALSAGSMFTLQKVEGLWKVVSEVPIWET